MYNMNELLNATLFSGASKMASYIVSFDVPSPKFNERDNSSSDDYFHMIFGIF